MWRLIRFSFRIGFLSLALGGTLAVAQQETEVSSSPSKTSNFSAAVDYQIHSLPLTGSQLLGPSVAYKVSSRQSIGTRYLLSPTTADERRLSLFWRLSSGKHFVGRSYYHWIFEPHYSYLWRNPSQGEFSTTGLAGGFQYAVDEQWLVGTMVGVERSGPVFPVGPFWDRPYFLVLTQFDF